MKRILTCLNCFILFRGRFSLLCGTVSRSRRGRCHSSRRRSRLGSGRFVEVISNDLCAFKRILPGKRCLNLRFIIGPSGTAIFYGIFCVFVTYEVSIGEVCARVRFSRVCFIRLFSMAEIGELVIRESIVFIVGTIRNDCRGRSINRVVFHACFNEVRLRCNAVKSVPFGLLA